MSNVTHKFLSMYLLLFLTLYMFRARHAHHQERQIVSIQTLVTVTLCWWPCRVQVALAHDCYLYHFWLYRIFPHYLINGIIFGKNLINKKILHLVDRASCNDSW
jgi:hypothetical protein